MPVLFWFPLVYFDALLTAAEAQARLLELEAHRKPGEPAVILMQ